MPKLRVRPIRSLALLIALAGCANSPTQTSAAPPTDVQCTSRVNDTAAKLVECIRQDSLWAHMQAFQQIADANPGPDGHPSRNSGEPGYLASVNYVAGLLQAAGYRVTVQTYHINYAAFTGTPQFAEVSPTARTFTLRTDWSTQPSSANSDVTAQLETVGNILVPAPPSPASTSGCSSNDFSGFTAGHIALIQAGTCAFATKAGLAANAGAAGAIIFNEGTPGRTGAGNCGGMQDVGIPVVCAASYAVGAALYTDAQQSATVVHLATPTVHDPQRADYNLIADSPYGDPHHVVVVDAHLDAIFGAGMLDNASGSSTILEIALKLAKTHTQNQLRYIWFGGEELGLLGSLYYTRNLPADSLANIVFDVDADVTATPNYVYAIADPANSRGVAHFPANVVPGSKVGNDAFASYFASVGLPSVNWSNDGTDSYSFSLVGVPNTGVLTGQDCCKSAADAALFGGSTGNFEGHVPGTDGGFVDRPFIWGDNLANNDPVVLETVSKAVASVVFKLANTPGLAASVR